MISLVTAAFLGSYIIPISLFLWKRLTTPANDIQYGPWRLGRFGVPVNIAALIWSVITMFFSFWPTTVNPTPQSMNWACLLYGATNIFSVLFYIVHGRFTYKGPVVETSVAEQFHVA